MFFFRSLAFASLLAGYIQAQKTAFVQDFSALDATEERKPPYSASTVTKWARGQYPRFCYDTARSQKANDDGRVNCDINNLEVFNVAYADCPDKPWTICRCTDAQLSVDQMVNAFGRVPPGIRSRVVHLIVVDGSRPDRSISKSGGSNNDRITIRGPIDDAAFMHESMHSVDQGFHESAQFQNAYNADSCVPDNYANTSPAEDFAQLGVWVHYDSNGIPIRNYIDRDFSCMGHQLEVVGQYAGGQINTHTSHCFDRRPNDDNVSATSRRPNSTGMGMTGGETAGIEVLPPAVNEYEDHW
jgi:hypothetical protein